MRIFFMAHPSGGLAGVFFSLLILSPRPLPGQTTTSWALPTTVGYGGLGCAGGYLMASEAIRAAELEGAPSPVRALGTAAGCWIGIRIGRSTGARADSLLAEGVALETGHRRGVQLGTVLAGATVATLVSFVHVSFQEGRDAEIIATYALAGAAVGAVVQVALNRRLYPPEEAPAPFLGLAPGGGLVLGALLRF